MMKNLALTCILAAIASQSAAQSNAHATSPHSAYLQDGRAIITRSGSALCWHTAYWTPADAVPGCDGVLAAPVAKVGTPAAISPPSPIAAPTAAPAPKPAAPKRCDFAITLQNDETFDFNKATLKSGAKQRIDSEMMAKLSTCARLDLVIVTGHTDLIGQHQANQKLSEKRADAVAAYLTSKGVNATIDTMGMGKTQQIKACDDKLPRAKLTECLAPNRRVVIEGRGIAR